MLEGMGMANQGEVVLGELHSAVIVVVVDRCISFEINRVTRRRRRRSGTATWDTVQGNYGMDGRMNRHSVSLINIQMR